MLYGWRRPLTAGLAAVSLIKWLSLPAAGIETTGLLYLLQLK